MMRRVWKYVKINSLRQAKKDENVCAYYPNPSKNTCGNKDEQQMKDAEKDAKAGKCKLLVWRLVEVEDDFYERLQFGGK